MKTLNDFQIESNKIFGEIPDVGLNIKMETLRLRISDIEISENVSDSERIYQATNNSLKILEDIFSNRDVWLKVVLWKDNSLTNLKKLSFSEKNYFSFSEKKEDFEIMYLYTDEFNKKNILPLIKAVVLHDFGFALDDDSVDITCYYINLTFPVIVNIYDDRGMNIATSNMKLLEKIRADFKDLIID